MNLLDIENLENKFNSIVFSKEFVELQKKYNDASHVFIFGHGGNLGVADHAAIDASRLTDKNVIAPGSGILATSIIGDTNFNDWLKNWIEMRVRGIDPSKCVALGMSCSSTGESSNTIKTALEWSSSQEIPSFMFTATPKQGVDSSVIQIVQDTVHYHTSEILSLMLTYQLIHGAGFSCPTINKKAAERKFEKMGIKSEVQEAYYNQQVPPGLESQDNNLAIDFDGVVHTFDRGWHDGTCYGEPIEGSIEAIKELSKKYRIIIFTAKVKEDRPLVNGKTGMTLVNEWLNKYELTSYISEVTSEKPRAKYYIDDKAIRFDNWSDVLGELK